jgi:hypothetical protein
MHAQSIVHRFVETHLCAIHAARRRVLSAAVSAAMGGQCVSLTRLSRGLLGGGCLKAAIKRVDRLIGHARIAEGAQIVGTGC